MILYIDWIDLHVSLFHKKIRINDDIHENESITEHLNIDSTVVL